MCTSKKNLHLQIIDIYVFILNAVLSDNITMIIFYVCIYSMYVSYYYNNYCV